MNANEELRNIARSLAAELSAADFPHLWRIVTSQGGEWWQDIKTDNAWLCLQHGQHNRLVIKADKPKQMRSAGNAETITASLDRKPEAIARDICARLLPNAREYWQRCLENTRQHQTHTRDHAELLHILAPFTTWKRTDSDETRTEWNAERARADIYTDRIYSLKIDSPTADEVIKILQILKG